MKASEAKVGEMYLSRTGIPVTMVGPRGEKFLIKLKTTGTFTMVNGDYDLKPYDEKHVGRDSKAILKANAKGKPADKAKAKDGVSLASIIDPLILAGGKTTQEIATELAKKAGEAGKGKDLNANVRARLVTYTRKGWQVIKDDKRHVKVVQKQA